MKTLREIVAGDTVFRWFPGIGVPMELKVTNVGFGWGANALWNLHPRNLDPP